MDSFSEMIRYIIFDEAKTFLCHQSTFLLGRFCTKKIQLLRLTFLCRKI